VRVNVAVPEGNVTPPVLNAMLEGVTRLNEQLIKEGAPTFREAVNRVRWAPEPPGQECFDHLGIVLARGKGDCDDLAPWHASSLRATGEDRGAKAIVKKSGPKRWHAVVQRSDGTIDDPSREAGMGQRRGTNPVLSSMPSVSGVGGVYEIERPQLALRPVRDRDGQIESWQARADLPWHWKSEKRPSDVAMASLHRSPVSSQAVVGAARGAMRLAEQSGLVDDYTLDGIEAIADACEGADWDELADEYGEEHADYAAHVVGSFFGGLKKAFKKVANNPIVNPLKLAERLPGPFGGLARMANPAAILNPGSLLREAATNPLFKTGLSFIPGVGPIASQALSMAAPALQQMVSRGGHLPPQMRQFMPPMGGGFMPPMGGGFMPQQFQQFAPQFGGFPGFPGFRGF
jgi:hypothetical protein